MANLVTQTEVEQFLGLAPNEDATRITNLISYWSDRIKMAAQPAILVEETIANEKHNGNGTDTVFTNHFPIISVTTLETESEGTIASDDYWVYPNEGEIVLKYAVFQTSHQEITITYTAGYGATVPDDIKLICLECIADAYKEAHAEVRPPEGMPAPPRAENRLNESAVIKRYRGFQI